MAEGQVAVTPSGDLKDGVSNSGLKRDAAIMPHAVEPMLRLEKGNVDLGRIVADTAQGKSIEIVFDDAALANVTFLIHHVVVEPRNLAFDLFSHAERVDQTEAFVMRDIDANKAYFALATERGRYGLGR